jgi:hypothetical protein
MKKYCLDTSGLSNPLEFMPEDIHVTLWGVLSVFFWQEVFRRRQKYMMS